MSTAEEVAAMIADDYWDTAGLKDIRQGVTREGYAQCKRRLAERIVEHVREAIRAELQSQPMYSLAQIVMSTDQ